MPYDEYDQYDGADADGDDTVPCPYCGAAIHEEAERCPHCENYISRGQRGTFWLSPRKPECPPLHCCPLLPGQGPAG